ncbi:TetR/AcrR family transcriptional regulator C-terminal domain-containing protein [Cellulomonas cellasea]|uniref:TetR/AcrR family transcriptional regulator C-terminal domain-containing protein n=1 Tax=Cellulomonas cellasea TaxID=43670 RepID=UPI0025A472D5|nr:TetR/AcrR family transcriptional regulator C-terminal domain-containing protein [Cellulomonas cellasea]MDM8083754.1 TetR/AcrR family transcriptional regulator C-terminal domain-containing protein [Cellulomonas cellasea]
MTKRLSRERIVAAALDQLDEHGIDGVTVRAVATRLEVKAPALYWHVHDKQELLDEMGTEIQRRVNAAFIAGFAGRDWRESLEGYARILRAEYLAHRDGARTFSGTRLTDPEALRAQEVWLRSWTAAGLQLADAMDAVDLVTSFVVGFVIEEQERSQSDAARYSLEARDAMVGDEAPLVVAAGHARGDEDARFERQLAIVLTGIDAQLGS